MALRAVGTPALEFVLPDQTGNNVQLSELCAKGPVVLFFYPKDETSVCTKEACGFRDAHGRFLRSGATVLGISPDSAQSHAAFVKHHGLPYQLLVDGGGRVADSFGVKKLFGLFPGRATFVVDQAQTIRLAYSSALDAQEHVNQALRVVSQLAQG